MVIKYINIFLFEIDVFHKKAACYIDNAAFLLGKLLIIIHQSWLAIGRIRL